MANEQLKQALRNAGLEADDLAVKAEVDLKTAQRWLSGRTPRPRYRRRVADALGVPEQVLWPGETPDHDGSDEPVGESVEVLTDSHDHPDWRELASDATERVCLLDLTLGQVLTDPDDGQLLAAAASRGCRVRVLLSDRDSVHLVLAEDDLGHPVSLTQRPASTTDIDRVRSLLTPHAQQGQVELRAFVGHGAYRVLIFDDQALVTLRLPGLPAESAPLLSLARDLSDGIFDRFARHFEAVWQTAEPLH